MVIKLLASPNELLWLMGIPGLLGRKGGEVLIAVMESCLCKKPLEALPEGWKPCSLK